LCADEWFIQARNRDGLYEAVRTVADMQGSVLRHPDLVALLMPPLLVRWDAVPDYDTDLFALFEVRVDPARPRTFPLEMRSMNEACSRTV
jgi:hypothetical protein